MTQTALLYISETKRQAETISYFGDFRDELVAGETINSQNVTVTCISGIDPDPSAMLYGGIDLNDGFTVLEQRIEQGVVGAIYDILFTVGTTLGNTYQKFTRLAILPNNLTAEQLHQTWQFTTWRYPYNAGPEGMQGYVGINTASMWLQPSWKEGIQGGVTILSGSLLTGAITYTCPKEGIQGNSVLLSGTLTLSVVSYSYDETIQGNAALLNGNLVTGNVSYTMVAESIQGNAILNSGILM